MQTLVVNQIPNWLKNISEDETIDVLDKGETNKYLPKWMLGKIKKIEYEIGYDDELIPIRILIHYLGWSNSWDEWFDLKNKSYINRLSKCYSKCDDLQHLLKIGSFIDVKINTDIVKKKFVCSEFSCSSCIKDKIICEKNKKHLNTCNLWRIGKIIQKDSKNIVVYISPSHVCWNKHRFDCKLPIILSFPLLSENILPLNTHTKSHCKNVFCKGCDYPNKSLTNVPWPSIIKNTLDTYFKKYPNSYNINKKYLEKHCPVCWMDFDDNVKPIWFECGHSVCNLCFNELCDKKETEYITCVYCRKNIFKFKSYDYSCYDFKDISFYSSHILSIYHKFYIIDYNYNIKSEIHIKYVVCIISDDVNDEKFKTYLFAEFGSTKYKDILKITNYNREEFRKIIDI